MTDSSPRPRLVIVAGMPRAATTFLYHTLAKHPGAWVPSRKEIEYFSLNHERGLDWYHAFFEGAGERVGFDISPIYFMDPAVPERIRGYDPDARVILLVRDPAEFVVSFFANRRGASHRELTFADFLAGHEYEKDGRTVDFVFDDGRIEETIERFRATFGRNLLLCSYEAVRTDPLPVLEAVEAFAGLSAYFDEDNFENVRVNASDQKNIVWLNRLMHTKWFVDLVVRLVPKTLILHARYWVQTRRTSGEGTPRAAPGGSTEMELAQRSLAGDRAYVERLFAGSGFLLGDGEPTSADALRGQRAT